MFTSPNISPRVMNAPTGILIAAQGTKPAGKIAISHIAPVDRISRIAAKTHSVRVKPAPIPNASMTLTSSVFLLAQASARQMMMQLTIIRGTYGPSISLILGWKARRNKSAIVTKVDIVSVNIRILKWGFSRFRIRLTIILLQSRTKMTQSPIVKAGFTAAVTASVGHIPSSRRKTGFSRHKPAMNVSPNKGALDILLAICFQFLCLQLLLYSVNICVEYLYDRFAAYGSPAYCDDFGIDSFGVTCLFEL